MKKLLIFILLAISMGGCMSTKYFQKHKDEVCGMCPEKIIEKHDSIYTQKIDTIYRISTVDSLIIVSGIFANLPQNFSTDTIIVHDKVYDVSIWIENSKLKANIKHLNDTISTIIKTNTTNTSNLQNKTITITKTVIKKAGRFYVWFFWIVIVLFAITIVLYYYKKRYLGWISKLFDSFDYK